METPPQLYKIRDLVLLPELNPRVQLCEETIIRYMESFEALPPVSIQEGTGVLVDGFHRVEAATRLGVEAIPVRMLDIPDEELHLYAGLANCNHGRPMSRARGSAVSCSPRSSRESPRSLMQSAILSSRFADQR